MQSEIENAVNALRKGELVCFPTDTVYALACDATNLSAVEKIYEVKARGKALPIAVLVSGVRMAESLVDIVPKVYELLDKYPKGAVSLILNKKADTSLAENLNSNNNTQAFRIPNHELSLNIIKALGKPIAATSANISGQETADSKQEIQEIFGNKVAYCIPEIYSESASNKASTVIDLSSGEVKILRK